MKFSTISKFKYSRNLVVPSELRQWNTFLIVFPSNLCHKVQRGPIFQCWQWLWKEDLVTPFCVKTEGRKGSPIILLGSRCLCRNYVLSTVARHASKPFSAFVLSVENEILKNIRSRIKVMLEWHTYGWMFLWFCVPVCACVIAARILKFVLGTPSCPRGWRFLWPSCLSKRWCWWIS